MLAWNGERFARSTYSSAFEALPDSERSEIMEQIDEARTAGWLK